MQLIAIQPAFYMGKRLRPGDEFTFTGTAERCGEPITLPTPRWAMPASDRAAAEAAINRVRNWNGDTKPAQAQKNARQRAGAA